MVWPALIGAGATLLGGLISNRANKRIAAENAANQQAFAEQGIRMRVEDAKAAGIHPVYALGASVPSFSPIALPDQLGPAMASAGQDISRAVRATRTQGEREDEVRSFMLEKERASDARVMARLAWETDQRLKQHEIQGLSIRNDTALLQNELTRLQLRRSLASDQVGPAMPSVLGSGNVKVKASEQTSSERGRASTEASVGAGKPSMVPYAVGTDRFGFTLDLPTPNVGEGLEGTGPAAWPLGAALLGGHYGAKFLDWILPPDLRAPPPGYDRRFDPRTGRFELVKRQR